MKKLFAPVSEVVAPGKEMEPLILVSGTVATKQEVELPTSILVVGAKRLNLHANFRGRFL